MGLDMLYAENNRIQTYQTPSIYTPVVQSLTEVRSGRKPKNIILMIGDGMGLSHVSAAWVLNGGHLNLDACTHIGLSRTYCADRLITDSGAGGTALAIGEKTNTHSCGVNTSGQEVPSLLHVAHAKGYKTGVSVTCHLCDATPADFCSHSVKRNNYSKIVSDFLASNVDFMVGGGKAYFANSVPNHNIINEMQAKGYHIYQTLDQLDQAKELPVLALLADSEYVATSKRGDWLPRQTMKAISLLNNPKKGFVMMVEGSHIDDYSHAQNLSLAMEETFEFDRTIGEVLRWAANNRETLVVITADHETGGLTILDGSIEEHKVDCKFSTTHHTNILVPIYAYGPGAEYFTGIHENAEVGKILQSLLK